MEGSVGSAELREGERTPQGGSVGPDLVAHDGVRGGRHGSPS